MDLKKLLTEAHHDILTAKYPGSRDDIPKGHFQLLASTANQPRLLLPKPFTSLSDRLVRNVGVCATSALRFYGLNTQEATNDSHRS